MKGQEYFFFVELQGYISLIIAQEKINCDIIEESVDIPHDLSKALL